MLRLFEANTHCFPFFSQAVAVGVKGDIVDVEHLRILSSRELSSAYLVTSSESSRLSVRNWGDVTATLSMVRLSLALILARREIMSCTNLLDSRNIEALIKTIEVTLKGEDLRNLEENERRWRRLKEIGEACM